MNLTYRSNFIKTVVSVFCIYIMLLIQSCSELTSVIPDEPNLKAGLNNTSAQQPDEYQFLDKKYKVPEGLYKWEAQLDKIIENNQLLMKNGLKLVNYKYVRDIASIYDLETVKRELNAGNSFFVVYSDDSIASFTIGEDEAVSKNYMKFLNYLLPTTDSEIASATYKEETTSAADLVYIFEKNDMGIVGLTWEYKGKPLNTTCLVSKRKGVVFDKILFCIPFEIKQYTEVTGISAKSHLKSVPPDGPISHADNYNYRGTNASGNVVFWEYDITATLFGQRIAGVKYATSPSVSYHAYGMDSSDSWSWLYGTWDCKAEARVLDFQDGPGGYMRYAYAWSYKHNGTVNISWNGSSYNVTGGGTSGGGEDFISVNELN